MPKTHSAEENQFRKLISSRPKHVYVSNNFSGVFRSKFSNLSHSSLKRISICLKITPVLNSNLLNKNRGPKKCRRASDFFFFILQYSSLLKMIAFHECKHKFQTEIDTQLKIYSNAQRTIRNRMLKTRIRSLFPFSQFVFSSLGQKDFA